MGQSSDSLNKMNSQQLLLNGKENWWLQWDKMEYDQVVIRGISMKEGQYTPGMILLIIYSKNRTNVTAGLTDVGNRL